MKKQLLTLLIVLSGLGAIAQTNIPQLVSFSAVVRDQNNNPLANTAVSLRLTFRQGGQSGPLVYCALHQDVTNANGFISIQLNRNVLGTACNGAPSTAFEDIPWENGGFWMDVEYQTNPGNPFINLGQLELASTFYAFAASTAERVVGLDLSTAQNGDVLTYNISTQQWEAAPAGGGFSGDYNDLTNTPTLSTVATSGDYNDLTNTPTNVSAFTNDAGYVTTLNDDDPINELQQLSVSATGDTLHLQNGGFVIIPGISVANNGPTVTIMDCDGNIYQSVVIGDQVWMSENLRTSCYANGDPILNLIDQADWSTTNDGAWCYYSNDSIAYAESFGKHYNWYAASDIRNVCPVGWHVPVDSEWVELVDFLGGNSVAGGKMKSLSLWNSPNTDATNETGFTGYAAGQRSWATSASTSGSFNYEGEYGYWWSATDPDPTLDLGRGRCMFYQDGQCYTCNVGKRAGFSIRCIKD